MSSGTTCSRRAGSGGRADVRGYWHRREASLRHRGRVRCRGLPRRPVESLCARRRPDRRAEPARRPSLRTVASLRRALLATGVRGPHVPAPGHREFCHRPPGGRRGLVPRRQPLVARRRSGRRGRPSPALAGPGGRAGGGAAVRGGSRARRSRRQRGGPRRAHGRRVQCAHRLRRARRKTGRLERGGVRPRPPVEGERRGRARPRRLGVDAGPRAARAAAHGLARNELAGGWSGLWGDSCARASSVRGLHGHRAHVRGAVLAHRAAHRDRRAGRRGASARVPPHLARRLFPQRAHGRDVAARLAVRRRTRLCAALVRASGFCLETPPQSRGVRHRLDRSGVPPCREPALCYGLLRSRADPISPVRRARPCGDRRARTPGASPTPPGRGRPVRARRRAFRSARSGVAG